MELNELFISPTVLHELCLQDKAPFIFDCRFSLAVTNRPAKSREFYEESHWPGARYLHLEEDLSAPLFEKSSRHPWPSQNQVEHLATRLNLTKDSRLVFYDDGKYAFAGRAWLIFKLAGFHRSRILWGGFNPSLPRSSASESELIEPESIEPESLLTSNDPLSATSVPIRLIDRTRLATAQSTLIDAREAIRYRGESEPIDPVAGTIKGAVNFPWLDSFDENGAFRPVVWHQQRWQSTAQNPPPIHFCGSGVTAIVNLLSALLADSPELLLYPGGWSEYLHFIPLSD